LTAQGKRRAGKMLAARAQLPVVQRARL